ncbi:MAG: type II toxin-antitoxin system VapC family toxin [Gammaproteobacteria bacterium]|nr:type II toxin-antitoxin system VapC family toxin [Gammaproteobacteria bacterium]
MFLLDTHVWLWSLLDPARLSAKALDALTEAETTLHLSSISLWESLLLAERGRIALEPSPPAWLRKAMTESPVSEVPLSMDVVMASVSVNLPHRDPADRLIAATAKSLDLILVTADRRLIDCRDIRALAV